MTSKPAKDAQHKPPASATRDHLANERTLLAWSRTAIAIMALGFVVARFGLLIRELNVKHVYPAGPSAGVSTYFGTALIASGSLVLVLALFNYLRTGRQIERGAYRWAPALSVGMAAVLAAAGVLLLVYLLVSG